MADLILHVKGEYFDQMLSGEKKEEFRQRTDYWRKRIVGRAYDNVVILRGYPKSTDADRRIVRPWRGYREARIEHPHFGDKPVDVFAIRLTSGGPTS